MGGNSLDHDEEAAEITERTWNHQRERTWECVREFDRMIVWEHRSEPSPDIAAPLKEIFDWMDIANAVSCMKYDNALFCVLFGLSIFIVMNVSLLRIPMKIIYFSPFNLVAWTVVDNDKDLVMDNVTTTQHRS